VPRRIDLKQCLRARRNVPQNVLPKRCSEHFCGPAVPTVKQGEHLLGRGLRLLQYSLYLDLWRAPLLTIRKVLLQLFRPIPTPEPRRQPPRHPAARNPPAPRDKTRGGRSDMHGLFRDHSPGSKTRLLQVALVRPSPQTWFIVSCAYDD
jgi:hypothetical protein